MKFSEIKYIAFFLFFIKGTFILSQHRLQVINNDNSPVFSKLTFQKAHTTKEAVTKEIRRIVLSLQGAGYLLCSADSVVNDSLNHKLYFTIGEQYRLMALRKGNAESYLLGEINYSERFYSNRVFKSAEVKKLLEKIIVYYENHGYPFATVKLDSVQINGKEISGALNVSKHKLIKVDSILIQGDLKVSKTFLYRYIDVKPGSFYNESALKNISQKIKQLPFAKETKPLQIKLTEKTNRVIIFASKRNSSQFDGIIGLLPTAGGKTVFTGDAKIKLQ
ncbi:MAG: hypothetical protein IAF38_05785, partial [Bacteroidia bacterium]|nr:hypothetical protein [Bacteroidia bacterium]